MQKIKIKSNLKNNNQYESECMLLIKNIYLKNKIPKFLYYLKLTLYLLFLISIIFINKIFILNIKHVSLKSFKKYINDCKIYIKYNQIKINNDIPYLSVCLSALNMEKYIEQNLLSIINQSFQDFEIVIVNDNSKDNTETIIKKIQLEDDRIKLINHSKNLGVYYSRIEAILNAKGNYIILMDPDDMFLNKDLFKSLYKYNWNNKLDIIEFTVYQQIDGERKIFYPNNHFENHYHNFSNEIIYQPKLSNLLYYIPGTKNYSHTICRNIWNKMIKRELFLKMHEFIGNEYFNEFVITTDDMLMNIIIYQFARNYSNIELPGYLYNIRKISMSRGEGGQKLKIIRTINHFFYFKLFYKYIKHFNKDRNYLFYEMKDLNHYILYIKEYNITKYIPIEEKFIKEVIEDSFSSKDFKKYLKGLLSYFNKQNS